MTTLEREGVSSILVDLGGNGGGSEWVSLAVRAVTGSALNVLATLIMKTDATASVSEYFAAVLRDSDAARIIGTRTMGAGCGYVDGGGEFVLPRTGLRVDVPNCVRLRKDGTNERAGIRPDVEFSSQSSGVERAREVIAAASQIEP